MIWCAGQVPVHMVSIQGKQAKGSHGIVIETEIGIAEVSEQIGDYLVLPGGMRGQNIWQPARR